ncbi:hypothetical protein BO79DRAFT_243990 [Aspergillus costaricaensis CBS 115574]|uniref:Uncharacterized protein n=1 Tax=Aspergillus costaricaensis CBS 115574 TaxID=1448317 RepID=A0ACD1IKQ4_9EURO|nr:hypothetical protein BO79DRAFT_243990 [Aspergillus costaricaensis CBS 115574]RAK91060.1 hypothetical protein BO79DRAFT_243990 [Aspergillus costaricaensis CBS 115574]
MPVPERASLHRIYHYGLLSLLFLHTSTAAGRSSSEQRATANPGYSYGQAVPVTCLNRTIDSGEHITDPLGNLQYIPFPTCNETSQPLSLHYGIAEQTLTCTIASLPDELYHLLEYYVHSDVPMTCRVPTAPLLSASPSSPDIDIIDDVDFTGEQAYTPITFAIQGTLQLSHLHIWTDMNVLVHNMASTEKKKNKRTDPGYVVAGTAYSVPEFDNRGAREPWTEGHGTKVVRGEPLTFRFSVKWVEGGRGIGWPSGGDGYEEEGSCGGGWFSRVVFFGFAAVVGAVLAVYWERVYGRGRGRGEGILGVTGGAGRKGFGGNGNGVRMNGYGGYSPASVAVGGGGGGGSVGGGGGYGGYGYGGYMSGKRD